MSETAWFLFIAVTALALASMAVRGVTRYQGWALAAYVCALVLGAALGAGIALAIDSTHWVLGASIGLAAVELGPAIGAAGRRVIRAKSERL